MDIRKKLYIKNTFDSILRADYLSLDKLEELNFLSSYYIDFFNSISSILQKQDSYVSGRRGTGKTSALLKGYYECLNSLKGKSEYLDKKVLPIYIDLSNCGDLFDKDNFELFEVHFVRQIIDSLKRQLETIYDQKSLIIFKKENPALDDLEYIEKILVEGKTVFHSKITKIEKKDSENESYEDSINFSGEKVGLNFKDSQGHSSETSQTFSQTKGLNVQEFLNKIIVLMNMQMFSYDTNEDIKAIKNS